MSSKTPEYRTMPINQRWCLAVMPDHGLALLKLLNLRESADTDIEVVAAVRSNAIEFYRPVAGEIYSQPSDKLLTIQAKDVSLQKLAEILVARDAAEAMAVFRLNRRELLHTVAKESRL
jgi:hypothetical protein